MVTWSNDGITLEGLLAAAADAGPQRLLVLLHGGPVGGLVCGEHPDPSAWVSAGFAVFMPDFRASGIAGQHLMTEAFRRPWLPAADPEAGDVLAGVDMLIANGAADGHALFLLGHSYGGYLAGRILARDHRFAAAACCDAVADLRLLDSASRKMQAAWLGSDPGRSPGRWASASPIEYARDIRTPLLLIYSASSGSVVQGPGLAGRTVCGPGRAQADHHRRGRPRVLIQPSPAATSPGGDRMVRACTTAEQGESPALTP